MTHRDVPTSVVPAVDPSRSSPDAVAPPAVFPEAAPPRATTPEDDYDEGDLCGPLDPGDKRAEMIAARCAAPGDYAAVGRALCDALATLGLVEDLRLFTLDREQVCVVIESSDKDVQPENAATCALEYALRAFKGLPLTDDEKSHHIRLRAPLAGSPSLVSGAPTAAETPTCPPCPECKSALTVEFGATYGCMECGHNWDRPRIPDDCCVTRADGECISSQPCMHSAPLARVPLLYAVEDAAYEYGYGMGAGRGSKRAKLDAARAALDAHLSTLERDAARMRARYETLRRLLFEDMDAIHELRCHAPDAFDAEVDRHVGPSGEPTTTPETNDG